MKQEIIETLTALLSPIKVLVFFTGIFGFLCLKKTAPLNFYLKLILFVCMITELCGVVLKDCICSCYSVSFIFHNTLWLLILKYFYKKGWFTYAIGAYLAFSIFNLFFIEGTKNLNYNTFIAGAFMYLAFFVYLSFYQLKQENLNFFLSKDYILLLAPVLFFIGLSFLFGFGDLKLLKIVIIGNIDIYNLIQTFINSIYYALLIIYIYKERGGKNV